MGIELFVIDEVRTQFINETKDVPLFIDGTKTMEDQLCYILNKEIDRISVKLGNEKVPVTPDIIRDLCKTAEEFESLAFRNYTIKCGAKISSTLTTLNEGETTVLIQVFIGDKLTETIPKAMQKATTDISSASPKSDHTKKVYRRNPGSSYNTSTDPGDF